MIIFVQMNVRIKFLYFNGFQIYKKIQLYKIQSKMTFSEKLLQAFLYLIRGFKSGLKLKKKGYNKSEDTRL